MFTTSRSGCALLLFRLGLFLGLLSKQLRVNVLNVLIFLPLSALEARFSCSLQLSLLPFSFSLLPLYLSFFRRFHLKAYIRTSEIRACIFPHNVPVLVPTVFFSMCRCIILINSIDSSKEFVMLHCSHKFIRIHLVTVLTHSHHKYSHGQRDALVYEVFNEYLVLFDHLQAFL